MRPRTFWMKILRIRYGDDMAKVQGRILAFVMASFCLSVFAFAISIWAVS